MKRSIQGRAGFGAKGDPIEGSPFVISGTGAFFSAGAADDIVADMGWSWGHNLVRSRRMQLALVAMVLGLAVMYPLSRINYLLFHVTVESFSMLVAVGIFIIAWNTRRIASNGYLLVLGSAHLFVGLIAMLHAVAYKGMGVFPGGGANLATQLWIVERSLEAAAFVVAGFALERKVSPVAVLVGFGTVSAVALAAVWAGVFPTMYIDGSGLTLAKVVAEYVIIALFLLGLALFWRGREHFEPGVSRMLIAAIVQMALAEVAFAVYQDVYGTLNFLGHYIALIAYVFIYRSLIVETLQAPYTSLFLELKRREEAEHRIAHKLQSAMVAAPERVSGIEMGSAFVSATESASVGGDFWDLFVPSEGTVAFVLGDVCGKGIDAATTTVMVRTTLRGFAYDDPDPVSVLQRTNEAVARQLPDDKFVTVIYGLIDIATGRVEVGTAGHPDPVRSTGGVVAPLELPSNPPLGVVPGYQFRTGCTELARGDSLVLFSDGLLEAGWHTEMLGLPRVVEHIRAGRELKPAGLARSLLDRALDQTGGSVDDDVAIVVLHFAAGLA